MASWHEEPPQDQVFVQFEDKSERVGNGAQGEPVTGNTACRAPSFPGTNTRARSEQAAAPDRQGDEKGSETRRAGLDHRGLGPGWLRRGSDRDELDDLLGDVRRSEEGWRVEPSSGSGTEGYW